MTRWTGGSYSLLESERQQPAVWEPPLLGIRDLLNLPIHQSTSEMTIEANLLGTAQDGGVPQAGC